MSEGPNDLSGEINIRVNVTPGADVEGVAREQGQQFSEAFREGVAGTPVPGPLVDTQASLTAIDDLAGQIETRLARTTDDLGLRMREALTVTPAVGVDQPFRNLTEAATAYREQLRLIEVELERITNGNVFSRGALPGQDSVTALERGLSELRRNVAGGHLDQSGILSEEARRAIEGGAVTVPNLDDFRASTVAALRRQGAAAPPSDAQEAMARAEAELQRVVVDNVAYGFRSGAWQQLNAAGAARGPVEDPAVLERLRGVAQTAVDGAVRAQLDTIAQRDPNFSRLGLAAGAEYGPYGIPSHEVLAQASAAPQTVQGLSDLAETLKSFAGETTDLNRALDVVRSNIVRLADEGAAYAENADRTAKAERDASEAAAQYEARLRQLTSAFADDTALRARQRDAITEEMYGYGLGTDKEYEQDRLRTEMQEYVASLRAAREAHQAEAERVAASLDLMYGGNGRGGGPGAPPPPPAGSEGDPDEFALRLGAAIRTLQAAAETAVPSVERLAPDLERLAGVLQLTEEQMRTVFSTGQLPARVGQAAEAAGTAGVVKTPGGALFGYDTRSGQVQGAITAEEALSRVDAQLAGSQREVGAAIEQTGKAARLTRDEIDALKGSQGILQRFWAAAFGGDVGDGGRGGGVNAFKRTAGDNAEFLGAITRYQIAYAGIFALSRGLHALVDDTTQSQVAIIHLSEALGEGSDAATRYASSLNDVATIAGTSVVAAMEAATRGIFAFNDEARTPAQRKEIGTESAKAAAIGHVVAGGDANQVQSELIAVTRDFNLTASDQIRVLDAATNAYHNYGSAIGDILQSLPIVSQQAHQAGLSIEETANYISLIETRTGQSGSAAGTALARILQSVQKPAFSTALQGAGVDINTSQSEQIQQLASRWHTLTQAQQNNFAQMAVGSRGAGAFLAIMQEGNGILAANRRSYEELGATQVLFYQQQNTLGGLIRRTGSDLQAVGLDLARSGVLDFAGVILRALDPLLHALDDVLRLIDLMPSSIRPWVTGLAEVLAVLVLIGRQQAKNVAETAVGGAGRIGIAEEAGLMAGGEETAIIASRGGLGGFLSRGVATGRAGATAAGAGLSRLGGALIGPVGAVAGVIALGVAAGAAVDAIKAEHAARAEATKAQKQFNDAGTVDQLHAAAGALANAAITQEHANSRFFGLAASADDHARVAQLQQQAVLANNLAVALQAEQTAGAATGRGGLSEYFVDSGGKDPVSALNNGISNLIAAGVPAVRMLELLSQAISSAGGSAADAGHVFGNVAFRISAVREVQRGVGDFNVAAADINRTGLGNILLGQGASNITGVSGALLPTPGRGSLGWHLENGQVVSSSGAALDDRSMQDFARRAFGQLADPKAVGNAVQKAMQQLSVDQGTVITPALEKRLADKTISLLGLDQVINGSARHRLTGAIEQYMGTIPTSAGSTLPRLRTQDQFNNFVLGTDNKPSQLDSINQYLQLFQDPRSATGNAEVLKAQIRPFQQAANLGYGGAAQVRVLSELHTAEDNYVKAQIANSERLRTAALAHDGGSATAQLATNARFVTQEIQTAGHYGDVSAIIGIIGTADDATMAIVRQHLRHDYDIAKAAYDADLAIVNDLESLPAGIRNTDPAVQAQIDKAQKALAKAGAAVRAALAPLKAFLDALSAGATTTDQQSEAKIDPRDIAIARIQATEIPGSALSAAQVALQVAEYQKAHAKNQQEYWQAVKAINDAEYQMMQATQDYMHQVRLEHIDTTNPVATTLEDLRTARSQLSADLARGAGKDTIATDRNSVTSAANAHQKAVFDQRMHDAQVAHDLGEKSDAAYLRFLEHQRDRLQTIAHKTRQQFEELQQVDEAIKAASQQFQGQWNLGSIRIPTPYEARRYVQAAGAAASSVAYSHTTQTVHVNIRDNTPDQKVRRIVNDILHVRQTSRLPTSPPKVTR